MVDSSHGYGAENKVHKQAVLGKDQIILPCMSDKAWTEEAKCRDIVVKQ
jgi:hypothetical protein